LYGEIMKKDFFLLIITLLFINSCIAQKSYADIEKTQSYSRSQEIKNMRFGMFICWSFSTFSGYEWTPGVEDISFFNPTGFEPEQWCRTARDAEMKYILFLTKHHDGFCLWDTETTDRKVSNTPALKGRDVLGEVRKACDKYGLKLALYFSEGDWSWSGLKNIHTSVDNPDVKKRQLSELLTNYGPIEFIWFDHAVGDGGLSHEETTEFVNRIQPDCFCGYNSGVPSGRLVLRERGGSGPIGGKDVLTGSPPKKDKSESYELFEVAEFTYPILEGRKSKKLRGAQWFYSLPENDHEVCSAETIYEDYLKAEKYGNIFSLNVSPDRSGRIREIDIKTLKKVGEYIRKEIKFTPEPLEYAE
jgi:alpha-L-fucosidase